MLTGKQGWTFYLVMGLLGNEGGLTGLEVILLTQCFDLSILVFRW